MIKVIFNTGDSIGRFDNALYAGLHFNGGDSIGRFDNVLYAGLHFNGGDNIGRFDYMYCILVYISMEVTTLVGLTMYCMLVYISIFLFYFKLSFQLFLYNSSYC
jgi:hypothetical protein